MNTASPSPSRRARGALPGADAGTGTDTSGTLPVPCEQPVPCAESGALRTTNVAT
jgi:hypothetical protein